MTSSAHCEPQFVALREASRIGVHATGQKLLDFGCGDGYLAQQYSYEASKVIAYDISKQGTWNHLKTDNLKFTTSITEVQDEATYDKIIINDVFDHIVIPPEWPGSLYGYHTHVLNTLTPLLTYGGTVSLVIHPWTGRLGAHLPENKVYYHLTALDNYLNNTKAMLTHKILKTEVFYTQCIENSNLKIVDISIDKIPLKPFEKHLLGPISRNLGYREEDISEIIAVDKIYYTLTHR